MLRFLGMIVSTLLAPQAGDSSVVATVGRYAITESDLRDSFEAGPAFVRRTENPLQKHLEFMVNERLLAIAADSLGYGESEFVKQRVSALEEDLAVDELYKADILAKVRLAEKTIAENVEKARTNIRFRWIYCPTKTMADNIRSSIEKGAAFDSLFQRQLQGTTTRSGRSMESTFLKLEKDNPDFAAQLKKLRKMEVSKPVEGKDGYYVIHIDEIWKNPVSTETEQAQLRDEAIKVGTFIQADALAGNYVKSRMRQSNPVLKAEGFNILRAYVAEKGLTRDTRVKWSIPSTFMTEAGPQPIASSPKFLNRPLVTFGKKVLTVRDYAEWFDIRQFQLKTSSLEAFNASIKQTVWKMVQDRLLSEEARRRGLQNLEVVRHEKSKWESKMLYLAGRSHVLRASVKEQPKAALSDGDEGVVLFRTLQTLRTRYPAVINYEILDRMATSVNREPAAIDVIFYKPGGTFPRVAFPTIDEAWSRMQ